MTQCSIVEAPRADVYAWHERPGAVVRLTPPWLPVTIRQEASDLAGGTAVLRFPLGLTWKARHREARAPGRFVDVLDSVPLRWAIRWSHFHEFEEVTPATTRVIDRIESNVPAALLREMVAYRHRQLADDLAARRRAVDAGLRPLKIAITGSHGTIGRQLSALLGTNGHRVIKLVRRHTDDPDERFWDVTNPAEDLLRDVDAVIHLAGASIAGRFTPDHRQSIRDSRIGPTLALARLAATTESGPKVFVCASAIGYYGADRGDDELTEDCGNGDGFLAELVDDWEAATSPAAEGGLRVVNIRTGLVQTPTGGVLRLQYPLHAAGVGGRLGSGRHWQPWISIDDLLDIYHRALYDAELAGPVNAVAPEPVRNANYSATLARVLNRPDLMRVPVVGLRTLLGAEAAGELALASQRVLPQRLMQAKHTFRHPDLESALRHVLGKTSRQVSS